MSYTASGTATSNQVAGDCKQNVCDGSGGVTSQNDDTDVPVDANQCTDDVCTNGVPSNPATASGTSCSQSGGTVCDGAGACVECTAGSQCTSGVCTANQCVPVAKLLFNELNPTISGGHDLIELLVTSAGTTNGIVVVQKGSSNQTLATLPDANVAAGDLIVVHLNPSSANGDAPNSETSSKDEQPAATYSANYDSAWDVEGGATSLTYSDRVLEVDAPDATVLDAIPVVVSTYGNPPGAFPGSLQALQAAGLWLPADCGGALCTYTSTPTAVAVSVDYVGTGIDALGNSISRKPGMNTRQKSDWNAAGPSSFGQPNP